MNILQFLRIFWARRAVTFIAVVASLIGAVIVMLLVQPRYEATARVMLDTLVRPDPVTGDSMTSRTAGPFLDSQMEMIKGYSVTGRIVDKFGLLSDPGQIRAYSRRSPSDTRDFRHWLAQGVADNITPKVIGSGTVLEITYRAPTAQLATIGAEELRQAYVETSLAARKDDAQKNAEFYSKQSEAARRLAEAAEGEKAAYEKSSGIIMQGRDSDLDSDRLASLAGQSAGPQINLPPQESPSALQLAQIDAAIADAAQRLGPNHPQMVELKARRDAISKFAALQERNQKALMNARPGAAALAQALQEQKNRVIGQTAQVERLRQLQSEVDLRREQYRTAAAKAGQYTVEAAVTDAGLTPLGVVVAPTAPAFPNKALMLGGAVGLGFALGLALSLLLELLNRHVRSVDDLRMSEEIHCIGVVEEPTGKNAGRKLRRALRGLIPQWTGAPL